MTESWSPMVSENLAGEFWRNAAVANRQAHSEDLRDPWRAIVGVVALRYCKRRVTPFHRSRLSPFSRRTIS